MGVVHGVHAVTLSPSCVSYRAGPPSINQSGGHAETYNTDGRDTGDTGDTADTRASNSSKPI